MSLTYNDMFGEHSKIDMAIARLKNFEEYALQLDPEGYYVCDSGGKDSSVIKQLCIDAGVKFGVYHSHTTVDHPETVYFVRREQQRFRDMGYNYTIEYAHDKDGNRITMWDLIAKRGLPIRTKRFCCEILKERGGEHRVIVTGVRWSESPRRKDKRGIYEGIVKGSIDNVILTTDNSEARKLVENCSKKSKTAVNPIIDWEDEDVWEYIRLRNIPYNPLYDMGWKRVGCIGCPLGKNPSEELEQNPKYKCAYIHAIQRHMEAHSENAAKYGWTAEGIYKWWVSKGLIRYKKNITMFDEESEEENDKD